MSMYGILLSNGLVFSCRERATTSRSKTNDLAREAVGWNTLLACPSGWATELLVSVPFMVDTPHQ